MNFEKIKLKLKQKNSIIAVSLVVVLLVASFFVYRITANAASNNQIAMKYVHMTGIDTGSGNFDSVDGLNYSDPTSLTTETGYTAGSDANKNNRIVRSFDTLTYHFNFEIVGKNPGNDYEEKNVNITVTLPDNIAKYVSFSENDLAGEKTHTFTFNGIDSYGPYSKDITLYVLGAPNGTKINPKFDIQESTNTETNYNITLGNVSGDTYYYDYDSENNNPYGSSNTSGFTNYMPSIVSSTRANVKLELKGQTSEGQKATYNNSVGRYLTYTYGVEIIGNETKGIKGLTMPNGDDITFDTTLSQNGTIPNVSTEDNWTRLYGVGVDGIDEVVTELPYSNPSFESGRRTKAPGSGTLSKISGYGVTYNSVRLGANSGKLSNANHYIGTYSTTVFSPRDAKDAKSDITSTMTISNIKIKDTAGVDIPISNVSASIINKYYEVVDYSLTGEFYDQANNKVSPGENGKGSTSKGTTLTYKTTFNYKKTLSDQGLKEIIKVDPNAYRVVPISSDKDIKITISAPDGSKLSSSDFEVKYVSGNYSAANYTGANFDTLDTRLNSEDTATIQSACSTVNSNLSKYSVDQVMNLYGGPCIQANADSELTYDKIISAKTDGDDSAEVPITKVIVQTKDGIKLPDSTIVTIEVGVRVRNVSDLTQTYQATSVATSSDYDKNLTYYAPRVINENEENSITNPNNYRKTVYTGAENGFGSSISSIDTNSVWGDCLKLVNFTSTQSITVKNKNKDGSTKFNYNSNSGETLNYNVKTNIVDNNEQVGADDVWYINNLRVYVLIPKELTYVPDVDLGTPEVINLSSGDTQLIYTLPYTKPNQKIKDINFKATIKPTIKGSGVPITVTSSVQAININGETDASFAGSLSSSFTIYVTGIENVIVLQKIGEQGSVIEKNNEFSYLLGGYNNTNNSMKDYSIVDILPSNGDSNGSKYSGSYKVKVTLPSSLNTAKVYCSTQDYSKLTNEVFNTNNVFEECNVTDEYVTATAIKVTDIPISSNSYFEDIKLSVKPTDNTYSDKYINSFVGGSQTYSQNESNKIETRVISRSISGRVFVDTDDDGIEEEGDKYLENIPVSIYKLDEDNNMKKIADTSTGKDGAYKFKDLDVGRYKIRADYDSSKYDVALRYATEDISIDSDAYKISDGTVEISNKRSPDESDGIKVTRQIEEVTDMNVGLTSRKVFGFDMTKYITQIDLNANNVLNTYTYENQSSVVLSVKNSLKATAKVYYGINVINNSTKAGYVKLINEDIPDGLIFDASDPYNSQWFAVNGSVQSSSLENDLIKPGESRYLKIALNMPRQEQARTFINTVTLVNIEPYEPEQLAVDTNASSNSYQVGEAVSYAGVKWHVVSTSDQEDGEQILTLMTDANTTGEKMGHTSGTYKWSESAINSYINNKFLTKNSLNTGILYDNVICDDASGLPTASYGGTLLSEGKCQSQIYNTYKVRLLTEAEYSSLKATNLSDLSWLSGSYWLMNSSYIEPKYDVYGVQTNSVAKHAKAIVNGNIKDDESANSTYEVRPVITISNRNIIPE